MRIFVSFLLLLVSSLGFSEEKIQLEGDKIVGDREVPKGLIIMPWREGAGGALQDLEFMKILELPVEMLDRKEVKRRLMLEAVVSGESAK